MDVDVDSRLEHLRRQRNAAAVVAVLLVLGSFGLALPVSLERYRALRAAEAELVERQRLINVLQHEIVDGQKQILELQRQINALRGK